MASLDPIEAVLVRLQRLRRLQRGRPARRRRLFLLLFTGAAVIVVVAAAGAVGAGGWYYLTRCTLEGRQAATLGRTSVVYAADGTYLGAIRAEIHRRVVPDDEISPWVKRATVAIEDRRFWSNRGIDFESLARAAVADLRAGRIVQGGSTITQQLVRSMYLDDTKSFTRKRLEACLAIKLTKRWSKKRILTAYLNRVPYGNRAYGIQAAAQTYF